MASTPSTSHTAASTSPPCCGCARCGSRPIARTRRSATCSSFVATAPTPRAPALRLARAQRHLDLRPSPDRRQRARPAGPHRARRAQPAARQRAGSRQVRRPSLLVTAAALDSNVRLYLLDGKQVELAPFAPAAEAFVGPGVVRASEVLEDLRATRYDVLLSAGRRKIARDDGLPLFVVAIDELAYFLRSPAKAERTRFEEVLRDVVSRGRAAGVIVLSATQKPSDDVIPTTVRDLFSFRLALRSTTPDASDTILGQGWATQCYSAATIDPANRGVGFPLAEGGIPVRCKLA